VEIDIDLQLALPPDVGEVLISRLPEGYVARFIGQQAASGRAEYAIKWADDLSRTVDTNAGIVIMDFLQGIASIHQTIQAEGGEMRLGIYYELRETTVFPLYLSAECIKLLASLGLSVDSTGYPCSVDNEQDSGTDRADHK
jgi:hypothetical protein